MAASPRDDLQQALRCLERRVARAWSSEAPATPRHLEGYRAAWLRTLARPRQAADEGALLRRAAAADLILASDFHALPRARAGLARLVRAAPRDAPPPVLLLELLPRGETLSARATGRRRERRLVTGARLDEVYAETLAALAERNGTVAGTWVDGGVATRDEAAARVWHAMSRGCRRPRRWILHFGDWHLADEHLPARLRALGGDPLVVHQSPEPLWEHRGADQATRVQRLAGGGCEHWAWLQDPPLSRAAATLAAPAGHALGEVAEAAEHLVESLALELARVVDLPAPGERLAWTIAESWERFRTALPAPMAAAHAAGPPRTPVFHPTRAACWTHRPPGWSALVQAATHALLCDAPDHGSDGGFDAQCRRHAVRHACAALLHPFHRAPTAAALAARMHPGLDRRALLRAVEAADAAGPDAPQACPPPVRELLAALWGARAGVALAAQPGTGGAVLRAWLQSGGKALDGELLRATIRAA